MANAVKVDIVTLEEWLAEIAVEIRQPDAQRRSRTPEAFDRLVRQ